MTAFMLQEQAPPMVRPRLGFLGVGWIGRSRMDAIQASGAGRVMAIAEPVPSAAADAAAIAPAAQVATSIDELLAHELDGIVIATPSAMHVEQSLRAIERGLAVFCQKPLGRTAAETASVVDAAQRANVLLGVDLSYRHTAAMQWLKQCVRSGDIGDVFAVDLVFHNAYGPDKAWYMDARLSGGGCVLDLGIHLVDLVYWVLGDVQLASVSSTLYRAGQRVRRLDDVVEDYAVASLELSNGATVRLACSWNLSAGQDAVIEATFFGTRGAARFRNVNGSFYDFVGEQLRGTACQQVVLPPDDWSGRAAVTWARQLARGNHYDRDIEQLVRVADTLDRILLR